MTARDTAGEQQQTLLGGDVEAERLSCEAYDGDCNPAEFEVDVFDPEIGEEISIKCCDPCRRELAGTNHEKGVRKLSLAERWSA